MSATETTAAAPVEDVKAVETPAVAPEAAPAAEAPAAVSFRSIYHYPFAHIRSRKHLKKKPKQRYV